MATVFDRTRDDCVFSVLWGTREAKKRRRDDDDDDDFEKEDETRGRPKARSSVDDETRDFDCVEVDEDYTRGIGILGKKRKTKREDDDDDDDEYYY